MKLREGETVIHNGRPHWIVFGWSILLGLLSVRFTLGTNLATNRQAAQVCLIIAGMLAVYALVAACVAQLYRWSSPLLLTNRRVVLKWRHPSAEVQRVSIAHHRICPGRISSQRPPLQLRHTDSPGLRWESGVYQAHFPPRACSRTHPPTAIARSALARAWRRVAAR